jgi:indole-3-acetate monooxygenase
MSGNVVATIGALPTWPFIKILAEPTIMNSTSHHILQQLSTHADSMRELGAQAETQRRLPLALVELMHDMSLFAILQPARYGGLELPIGDALEIIAKVASIDAAIGWCLLKGASSNQMAHYMNESAGNEIWSGPRVCVAGNFNPTKGRAVLDGVGYRLEGRWDWGTGSTHSQWLICGAMVFETDSAPAPMMTPAKTPVIKAFMVPASSCQLSDTWHTHGMRGTGSGDFEVKQLHVSADYAFDGLFAAPVTHSSLSTVPYAMQAPLPHAALAIGIAQGALDQFKILASIKAPLMTQALLKDRELIQRTYGEAAAMVKSSRAYLNHVTQLAWQQAQLGTLSQATGGEISLACADITQRCVLAVDSCYQLAGGTAVFEASPLQRAFRDIRVAASHFLVNSDKYTATGKQLLN